MRTGMGRYGRIAAGLVAAAGLAACGSDDTTAVRQNARVMVVHASPDAPAVDVLVDAGTALTGVPFRAASNYLPVPAGMRRFRVNAAGTSTTVIDVSRSLTANMDYTVLAIGRVADIEPLLLTDDNSAPASGNVKRRVVHGAPSAPAVDVYVTAPDADLQAATPVLTGVPFKTASGYLSVPAGPYQVRVTPAGTKTVAIDTGPVTLSAGQVRTAVAVDVPGGGAPFGVVLLAGRN